MTTNQPWIIVVVMLSLATGWMLGQWWRAREIRRNRNRLKRLSRQILQDAEREGKAKIIDAELEAQALLLRERKDFELEIEAEKRALLEREQKLDRRHEYVMQAEKALEEERQRVRSINSELEAREQELARIEGELSERLVSLAGLSREEARERIIEDQVEEARQVAVVEAGRVISAARHEAQAAARTIMMTAMEREVRENHWERLTASVPLPSEEFKARIIGRDGRNVRAFEAITGVDVLLDEVPGHVVLSCFDPFRRAVAKRTLDRLIVDGRIQPSRIEEFFNQVQRDIRVESEQEAHRAVRELTSVAVAEEVVQAFARLQFRASYLQNVYEHSLEAARFASRIAAELHVPAEERRDLILATLFHDIGKALGDEYGESHALAGAEFLRRHGCGKRVVNAVAAHHGEVPDESVLAPLLRVADGVSGGRPGARRKDVDSHVKRLEEMERLALESRGVQKAYVFQAGRELVVIVRSDEVSDTEAAFLAHEIARKIERELRAGFPVKISVVRESRATEIAAWGVQGVPEDTTTRAPE